MVTINTLTYKKEETVDLPKGMTASLFLQIRGQLDEFQLHYADPETGRVDSTPMKLNSSIDDRMQLVVVPKTLFPSRKK